MTSPPTKFVWEIFEAKFSIFFCSSLPSPGEKEAWNSYNMGESMNYNPTYKY